MKITRVEPFVVWADYRNMVFVQVETDEGISGVGEADLTSRELAVAGFVQHLAALLEGQDPARIEYLWQKMFRGGFFPADRIGAAAIAAIDAALWDIRGKVLNVPVYQLLGGLAREKVVCYPHNGGATTEDLVENCRKTWEAGWKFVRFSLDDQNGVLEPGVALRRSLHEVEAVRLALGDEVEICIDVHTRLDPVDALTYCRAVEQYRPFFVEDPVRSESPAALRQLRERTGVPLAIGEQFASKWEFRTVIDEDLLDYARLDPCVCGGLTESKKITAWCEGHYVNIVPHMPNGPLAAAMCLHLDLASPNFAVQELPRATNTFLTDVFPVQPEFKDGYLLPPTAPGLGIVFDAEAARKRPFKMVELPHLRRADGSVTNW